MSRVRQTASIFLGRRYDSPFLQCPSNSFNLTLPSSQELRRFSISSSNYPSITNCSCVQGLTLSSRSQIFQSRLQCNVRKSPASNFRGLTMSSALGDPSTSVGMRRRRSNEGEEEGTANEGDEDEGSYLKSHPYRQICWWKSKTELADVLVKEMIYNENGIFVTNKPFGVGVKNPTPGLGRNQKAGNSLQLHLRGNQTSPYTLEDVLPNLRALLGKPSLVLVKSTEKLTSGLAIFADNEETGQRFSKALKSSKGYFDTLYKYHLITVLPPIILHPEKVDRLGVTTKAGAGTDTAQPILLHEYSKNSVKRQDVTSVHAQTKIIQYATNGLGFLTEINTSSTKNNFLRIYAVDKLAPILGDHLYSCRVQTLKGIPTKIDPTHLSPGSSHQKLPKEMLKLLQLKKPDDSLIVPTHVHLRSFKLRKFLSGKAEIEFEAPYPAYFKWTCSQLGITLDEERP